MRHNPLSWDVLNAHGRPSSNHGEQYVCHGLSCPALSRLIRLQKLLMPTMSIWSMSGTMFCYSSIMNHDIFTLTSNSFLLRSKGGETVRGKNSVWIDIAYIYGENSVLKCWLRHAYILIFTLDAIYSSIHGIFALGGVRLMNCYDV